jgi:hypothetical protein
VRASWIDDGEIRRAAAFFRPPIVGDIVGLDAVAWPGGWVPDLGQ